MNINNQLKHPLKLVRWRLRRAAAARRWGAEALRQAPIVLGNAMPKSGSHLIHQVVHGLTGVGPFIDGGFPPVNRDQDNDKLPDAAVLANLQRMRPGDIGYGYLKAREPYVSLLTGQGWAAIFVYRDPRDMLVSHVFYATQMHTGHGMHRYYTETLGTMEERLNAAIQGVPEDPQNPDRGWMLSPVLAKYDGYVGWLEQPAVLCLRFEDLILERQAALGRILDYLQQRGFKLSGERTQAIAALEAAIAPKKSGTFRKGQPGNWREHFSAANKAVFKAQTGDLLVRLGYEQNDEW